MKKKKFQEEQANCALSGCDLKAAIGLERPDSDHSICELFTDSLAASDC